MACRFFAAGHCRHGSRCRFQHQAPPGEPNICIPWATAAPTRNVEIDPGLAPSASSTAAAPPPPPPEEPDRPECTLLSLALCDGDTQDFECCICFDLLADPRQCINGHPCCLACLALHLPLSQTCPTCRVPMQLENAGRNLQLERQISALRFRCKNEGCPATFVRVERETHEQQCQYRLVECACRCRAAVHTFYAHLQTCAVWRDAGRQAEDLARAVRRVAELEAEVQCLQADLDGRLRDVDAARKERDTEKDKCSAMLDGVLKELQKQPKSKEMPLESKQQAIVSHIHSLKQSLQMAEENATACEKVSERLSQQKLEERVKFSGMLKGITDSLRDVGFDMEDPWVSDDLEDQVSYIAAQIEHVDASLKMHQVLLDCKEQALQRQTAMAAAAKEELSRCVPKQRLEEEKAKCTATLGVIMEALRPEAIQSPACDIKDQKGCILSQIRQLKQAIASTTEALQRQTAVAVAAKEELSRCVPKQRLEEEQAKCTATLGDIVAALQPEATRSPYTPSGVIVDTKRCVSLIQQLKQTISTSKEALQRQTAVAAAAKEELSRPGWTSQCARWGGVALPGPRCVPKQRLAEEKAKCTAILGDIMEALRVKSLPVYYFSEEKIDHIVTEIHKLQQTIQQQEKRMATMAAEFDRDLKTARNHCSRLELKLEEEQQKPRLGCNARAVVGLLCFLFFAATVTAAADIDSTRTENHKLQQIIQQQEKRMAAMASEFDGRPACWLF